MVLRCQNVWKLFVQSCGARVVWLAPPLVEAPVKKLATVLQITKQSGLSSRSTSVSACLGFFFGRGGFRIRLEQDTASRLFPMVLQHFAPSAPRVAEYARGRFLRSLPHRTDPTWCLRAGRSRGGAVQDLQAGPLQGALRSRPEDRGLHLLRGGGHQPTGQGQNLLRKIKAYL